jgi:hypothetical protein
VAGQSRSLGGCRGYQSAAEETCVSWFGAQNGLANMTTKAARIEARRRAGLAHGCWQSIDRGSAVSSQCSQCLGRRVQAALAEAGWLRGWSCVGSLEPGSGHRVRAQRIFVMRQRRRRLSNRVQVCEAFFVTTSFVIARPWTRTTGAVLLAGPGGLAPPGLHLDPNPNPILSVGTFSWLQSSFISLNLSIPSNQASDKPSSPA